MVKEQKTERSVKSVPESYLNFLHYCHMPCRITGIRLLQQLKWLHDINH